MGEAEQSEKEKHLIWKVDEISESIKDEGTSQNEIDKWKGTKCSYLLIEDEKKSGGRKDSRIDK